MGGKYFMVDAGGGNQVLKNLKEVNIDLVKIHDIFVTHTHTDHVLGVIWVIRNILQAIKSNKYEGNLRIFSHKKVLDLIKTICTQGLPPKLVSLMQGRIIFNDYTDNLHFETCNIEFTAFDILSTKEKQFGFSTKFKDGTKLTYLGDEPFNESCREHAINSDILITEAFCLYKDRDIFKPYEKHHSTVMDAARCATDLNAKTLILFHTEDSDLEHRKENYTKEASKYFSGHVFVPNDLELINF